MYCVKCTKTLAGIPSFHGKYVNLTISQQQLKSFITIVNFLEDQF